MRRPQPLEILQPSSVQEASSIMQAKGFGGHFLAGGTDLVIAVKEKGLVPKFVVDLKQIPDLSGIREDPDGGLTIGATTTMHGIETSHTVLERYPFLAQSAAEVGSTQIRNRATIGGNIANATPSADVVPGLLVLEARICITNKAEQRIVELEDFFVGPGRTVMGCGDIITKIMIPPSTQGIVGEYIKFSPRETMDLAYIGVAVALNLSQQNRCEMARIALSAVSPTPMRAKAAEALLLGQTLDEQLAEQAGEQAARECKPIDDVRSSADYRREMVRAMSKRALLNVAARESGPVPWKKRRDKRY